MRYDTVYGRYGKAVRSDGGTLVVDEARYRVLNEKDPGQLPWRDIGVDLVFECTGVFTKREVLEKHHQVGAKRNAVMSTIHAYTSRRRRSMPDEQVGPRPSGGGEFRPHHNGRCEGDGKAAAGLCWQV